MRSHNPAAPNFLDQSDHRFTELHKVCDSLFRELRSQGLGSETKQASIITKDEENLLWSRGIMGLHSPLSLIRTVFYYVGKVFCLRGREEHINSLSLKEKKILIGISTQNTLRKTGVVVLVS